ncbi:MAG: tetratricopeptide repeat protein [Spirochaetales bacterium]|nr:tetratricopeptide repeat protein [Spirochaetales bacterium]
MKKRVYPGKILVALAVLGIAAPLSAYEEILQEGIDAFRRSDFDSAILRFREILLEDPEAETEATAYFWLAKSAMANGRLSEAERNLEFYLQTFPNHEFSVEAQYQRGRLLFMQEDYEGAIQALNGFVSDHPASPFVANAIYWSAESLFNLGRLDQARRLFDTVIRDYTTSFRVEAARYRIAVIDLTFREQELLQLLQWSHEEYLQALDEFQRRERSYQEAIVSYQQRLQNAASEDFREEIIRLTTQLRSMQETVRSRDAQIRRLEEQLTSLRNETATGENSGASGQ